VKSLEDKKKLVPERPKTYIINIEQFRRQSPRKVLLDAGLLSPQEMGHFLRLEAVRLWAW
jgi:hypothetical protein